MTKPKPPQPDDRGTCRGCPSSAEGCEARRRFGGGSCCSECDHQTRRRPGDRPSRADFFFYPLRRAYFAC